MKRLLTLLCLSAFSSVAWCVDLTKSSAAVSAIKSAGDDAKTIAISILLILTIIAGYKLLRKSL